MDSSNSFPPARIIMTERIKAFYREVFPHLEAAAKMMSTPECKITPLDSFLMPIEGYLNAYKKKSVLIKVHAEESFVGEIYLFFEFKAALILGAYLRQMTPEALKEKLTKLAFDEVDSDSFGEVGNQLCGILDRCFRSFTSRKIHLRMDFKKSVFPDEVISVEKFINKEEYVVNLAKISFPEDDNQKISLLIPRSLFESLLNIEIDLESIKRNKILLYSYDSDFCLNMQKELNDRHTKISIAKDPEDVLSLAKTEQPTAIVMELAELKHPLPQPLSLLIKRIQANEHIKRVPFIFTASGITTDTVSQVHKLGLSACTQIDLKQQLASWIKKVVQNN